MNTTAPTAPQGLTIEEAMAEAQGRWDAGQAQHAEMLCQQVLAAWPGHSDALHLLGLMAFAFGNIDSAIDHVRRACQAPRPPAAYFANLSEMCRQRGLLAEAEQAGRRAVALEPSFIAGWNNLGIALQEAGKLDESLACVQRVVRFCPDDAMAHNNLANTYKRMGRLVEARTEYEAALRLAPDYAEGHSNLANLLSELGEPDAALASARRAIEANPRLAAAYINAVGIETGRRRYTEALRWADALLSFDPMHAGGLNARSQVLRHLDRHDEAVAAGRLAAAAAPNDSDALNALGEALQAAGRPDEALKVYDRAASAEGFAKDRAAVNRGVLMMEQGDKAKAREAVEQALAAHPRAAFGWLTLSDLKRFDASDADLQQMEALLGPGGVEGRADRMALHFALGKAWMDVGDAQKAFAHLNRGARMHRDTYVYDGDATAAWVTGLADLYDEALYARLAGAGAPSATPVFVLGMPRSGTTLVEQILASHPKVFGAGELNAMTQLTEPHGGVDGLAAKLTPELAKSLGQAYLHKIMALGGDKDRVVDKMPANFLMRGLIPLILPGASIIHVRRNAVDTCLSCYSKHFASEQMFTYDQAELGQFYRAYEGLMDRWRERLPQDRYIEVFYEDVVGDLAGQARRLIDFIGLEWDEACLSFDKTRRTVRTASVNQVREPIFTTSVGRWKPFAKELKPLLDALGDAAR
jgi:tetratricopeptide (TPR) repeat protein